MSGAHTPGPWWVTDSGIRDAGGYICHTNKATHYQGQDERYESETAERAANALLIAAAPDLLAALIEMEREKADYMTRNKRGNPAVEHTNKMARAAIAKATGAAS